MRVVLSDTEWYYGKYVLFAIIGIVAVGGGVGIYYYENRTNGMSQTETVNIQSKTIAHLQTNTPFENDSKEKATEKQGIPIGVRLDESLKVEAVKNEEPSQTENNPQMIAVGIQGAVQKPGLYWIAEGTRLQELIDKAGGPLENAELRYLNIAAILLDGTTVVIPEKQKVEFDGQRLSARGASQPKTAVLSEGNAYVPYSAHASSIQRSSPSDISSSAPGEKLGASSTGLIDINHASQKELETLPGIGPVLAQSIISYRENQPFRSVEDLLKVSGIGPKRYEKIRHLVTVSPP